MRARTENGNEKINIVEHLAYVIVHKYENLFLIKINTCELIIM